MTPRSRPSTVLLSLCFGAGAYSFLQSLVVPALPTLADELGTTSTGAAWIFTVFMLTSCVSTPLVGRLGDILGRKRMLIAMLSSVLAGSLMCAFAGALPLMLAGRALQGLGGAIVPLAFGVIRDVVPTGVANGVALVSGSLGLGAALGIVAAGPILDYLGFHGLFWVPFGAIAVALAAAAIVVPESTERATGRLRWGAAALFAASLVALLVAVSKAPDWGWHSPQTIVLASASVVLAAWWVLAERRADQPLIATDLVLDGGLRWASLAAFLSGWAMFSGFVLVPQYLQEPISTGYGFGLSVTASGLYLLPWTVLVAVASGIGGPICKRLGAKWSLAGGALMGFAGFVLLLADRSETWELAVASGVTGFGVGLAFSALPNLVVEGVAHTETAVATGVNLIMRNIGGLIGTQVALTLVAGTAAADGTASESGYEVAFAVSAVALAVTLAAAVAAPGRSTASIPLATDTG
ncbi:MAG: MFS transporter [Gaiellales bacterium]